MADNRSSGAGTGGQSQGTAGSGLRDAVSSAASAAGTQAAGAANEAVRQVKEGASSLLGEATAAIGDYAGGQMETVSHSIDDFAEAIRKASDELRDRDQTFASSLVRQAASGLEDLSRAVAGSDVGDILSSVRSFGRRNPVALIGGAVLVGLALGRMARSSAPAANGDDDDEWLSGGVGNGQPSSRSGYGGGGMRNSSASGATVHRSGATGGRPASASTSSGSSSSPSSGQRPASADRQAASARAVQPAARAVARVDGRLDRAEGPGRAARPAQAPAPRDREQAAAAPARVRAGGRRPSPAPARRPSLAPRMRREVRVSQATDTRSLTQLISDLARELTTLFRKEVQLAKAEVAEKVAQLQLGVMMIVLGGLVGLIALNVLAGALVAAVATIGDPDIGPGWAALIVGVLMAAVAGFLVMRGTSDLKPSKLTPDRSVRQVKEDASLMKEQIR